MEKLTFYAWLLGLSEIFRRSAYIVSNCVFFSFFSFREECGLDKNVI